MSTTSLSSGMRNILLAIAVVLIIGSIWYLESQKVKVPSREGSEEAQSPVVEIEGAREDDNQMQTPYQLWQASLSAKDKERIALKEQQYLKSPELKGIVGYINAEEDLKIANLRGKIVLIDFWTYSCINCIRTLPHLVRWHEEYSNKGLVIIGVHTPEFEFEKDIENVKMAMQKYGVEYAVIQDNEYETWREFKNRYWPRKYLIDADGFIRYDHIGEGAYKETEEFIQGLLAEAGQDTSDIKESALEDITPRRRTTPELYAGHSFALNRGQNLGNEGGMVPNEERRYTLPSPLPQNQMSLEGLWFSQSEHLEAREDGASLVLPFSAGNVNAVLQRASTPLEMEVLINGAPVSKEMRGSDIQEQDGKTIVIINEPRLYALIEGEHQDAVLTLTMQKEAMLNAFTFG